MKITCDREKLLAAFQTAAMVAPSRSPKAILQNVKVVADPERTILTATDMEVGVQIEVEDITVDVPGMALLSVAGFGSILRENTDERLRIEADGSGIQVVNCRPVTTPISSRLLNPMEVKVLLRLQRFR